MKANCSQRLRQAAPWLWMAAGYVFMLWYHIVPGAWIIDSDLAGEMVLADLLNREGGLLSTNWYYTTELRVFHLQWFYRLGLLLFPHDWHAARVAAMALVLALLAAAGLFFTRAAGMGQAGVWCAAALLWPFGFWYLFLGLYGGYYLVYIIFTFLILGTVLRLRQPLPRRTALLWLALGAVLSVMNGLNGVRQLLVLYVPLLAALLALAVWQVHTAPAQQPLTLRQALRTCPEVLRMLGSALFFTLCSAAGYLVNMAVLTKNHSFRAYDTMAWQSEFTPMLTTWRDFLLLFGYRDGQPLFSFTGIASGLGLLLGLAVPASLFLLVRRFARLELQHRAVVAFILSGLLIQALVFCFLGPYTPNYWLPFLPFGLVALLLAIRTGSFRLRGARPLLALALAVCLSVCSFATVRGELAAPLRGKPGLAQVVDWLLDHGYTGGYSEFWTSQAVTELSDGQIEMWTIFNGKDLYRWLQRIDHRERVPEAPYFVLFEGETVPEAFAGGTEVYRDGRYVVCEYTDPAGL